MRFSKPWLRVLANLFGNMAAAWFAAALLVPTISGFVSPIYPGVLFYDLMFGTVYLLIAVQVERELDKYD
ncbi:MAG: hypothetical protein G01um101416_339 [Microgenomates group bacterium Gr01-1014_16]|nr:MAG: hypothetical protein G01um101416_339 [Microgenomates group bacterium Gr01-1014_16]